MDKKTQEQDKEQSIIAMRDQAEKLKSSLPDFSFKFEAIIRLLDDVSYRQFNTKF